MKTHRWPAKLLPLFVVSVTVFGAALVWLHGQAGMYGLNILLQRGGSYWSAVEQDSARLSPAMRLALREDVPNAVGDPPTWLEVAPGLSVGDMPVRVGSVEVDRLLLARIDTTHFRFVVRTAPAGNRGVQDWMRELGAVLVVNGSYYDRRGAPDTPLVSDRVRLGPATYEARHGAFVATTTSAGIADLSEGGWKDALADASDAFVSYPLLLARDGSIRAEGDRRWLANRSFVGEDQEGRIIVGTTVDAFFSLRRFAEFLRTAPLDLATALNLDGGPVACQAIKTGTYERDFCGAWETKTEDDGLRLLRWPFWWQRFNLPIVLAVLPR